MRGARASLVCLLAGGLAVLLVAQVGAAQESSSSSSKKQKATDENNEQTQDKRKDIWEEQQERRLLVKRATQPAWSYRADPMLADTRRGPLGASAARSLSEPSARNAFFSKRRRLHSRARSASASAKARSMARPSARTSTRRLSQRSVVPAARQRRRFRSGARSLAGRRARRFRQSRQFVGWQPVQLARFARSTIEQAAANEDDEDAQFIQSFDEPLSVAPSTARAGFAPFLKSPNIVQQQQAPCLCAGQAAGSSSQAEAGQRHQQDTLALKAEGAKLGAHFADDHHQKSEQISVGFGPFELLKIRKTIEESHDERLGELLAQTIRAELERERKHASEHLKQAEQLNQLLTLTNKTKTKTNTKKTRASSRQMARQLSRKQRRPNESHESPRSSAGSLGQFASGALGASGQPPVQVDGEQETPRATLGTALDTVGQVAGNADDASGKLPVVGGLADKLTDGVDLKKTTGTIKTDVQQALPGSRQAGDSLDGGALPLPSGALDQPRAELNLEGPAGSLKSEGQKELPQARKGSPVGKVDDAAEQPVGKTGKLAGQLPVKQAVGQVADTAEGSLKSLQNDKRPQGGARADADVDVPRFKINQAGAGPLLTVPDEVAVVEESASTAGDQLEENDSRKEKPEQKGDSQASAGPKQPLKSSPGTTDSLAGASLGANGPQDAKLSGSLTRNGAKDPETKLDEEIKNTKPNLGALTGSKRGSGVLDAIGGTIKHKLETPEVKQEVKAATSGGQLQVVPELQRERDQREHEQKWQQQQPATEEQHQEQEAPRKQTLEKSQTEQAQPEEQQQAAWQKAEQPEQQQEHHQQEEHHKDEHRVSEHHSVSSSSGSEEPHEEKAAKLAKLVADVEQVEQDAKALEHKVEQSLEPAHEHGAQHEHDGQQEQEQQQHHQQQHHHHQQPEEPKKQQQQHAHLKVPLPLAPTPGLKPLLPVGPAAQVAQPLKSTKGYLLSQPSPALYESPRIERLPAKCTAKLHDLTGLLNEILLLIERLGQRVLADPTIDYLTRDSLSRKLAMVRAFTEEARMQANLGQLRRLNDSARTAGVELMRLANWSAAHKLDKNLRPLALQMRKFYIAYRKACKGVGSS